MNGKLKSDDDQRLPQPGDIDLMIGGPPCQVLAEWIGSALVNIRFQKLADHNIS